MKNKLIAHFSRYRALTTEQEAAILDSMDIRLFKKGEHLLREGQMARSNYFVLEGCIRQYYLKEGGELTANFFTEEQWVLPSLGLGEDRTSEYNLECLENCQLVIGNEEKGDQLITRFPEFYELAQLILEREIVQQQQSMSAYLKNSPEERYLRLLNTEKDLVNRVPQYHLASYIGVKPESLSRIRKRLAQKK